MIQEFMEANRKMTEIMNLAPSILKEKNQELLSLEEEENDIKHVMELSKLNAAEGYRIYQEMHTVLQKRRQVKNEIKALMSIVNKKYMIEVKNHLENWKHELSEKESNNNSKVYNLRVRTDFINKYGHKCNLQIDTEERKAARKASYKARKEKKREAKREINMVTETKTNKHGIPIK